MSITRTRTMFFATLALTGAGVALTAVSAPAGADAGGSLALAALPDDVSRGVAEDNDADPEDKPECRYPCKTACGAEDAELPGFACPKGTVCCKPPANLCDGSCRKQCADDEYVRSPYGCPGDQVCCKAKPTPAPQPPMPVDE